MEVTRTPVPGWVKQAVNNACHTSWGSVVAYHTWWLLVSILQLPFSLVFLALSLLWEILMLMMGFRGGRGLVSRSERGVVPLSKRGGLVVAVTGCDSGFGHGAAKELAERGFTVFAGCLDPDAFLSGDGDGDGDGDGSDKGSVVACKLDVTNQESVDAFAARVREHIHAGSSSSSTSSPCALHAVVNNAGVGSGGCVDWLDLADFQRDMDVNYFGMIRVTKALLPLLKEQAQAPSAAPRAASRAAPRVVNVTSMAGLMPVPFMSPYCSSKHAAEAFSACLRTELQAWGVLVATVNPRYFVDCLFPLFFALLFLSSR